MIRVLRLIGNQLRRGATSRGNNLFLKFACKIFSLEKYVQKIFESRREIHLQSC